MFCPIFNIFDYSIVLNTLNSGLTWKPNCFKYSNDSLCVLNCFEFISSKLNMNISNGLFAVNLESNWRKEPAAKFLGFAYSG